MPIALPPSLIEYLLLGPAGDRRLLQDSPILGDVWAAYAGNPTAPQDLLITPHRDLSADLVASKLDDLMAPYREKREHRRPSADIASLQGIVAARLTFQEVIDLLVPHTTWANTPRLQQQRLESTSPDWSLQVRRALTSMARHWSDPVGFPRPERRLSAFERYVALAGLISWAGRAEVPGLPEARDRAIADAIDLSPELAASIQGVTDRMNESDEAVVLFYQLALNRQALMAIARSVPAIKGDAARGLFAVNCQDIAWAVLDSGINGKHVAFEDTEGNSRVKRTYDFRNLRKIISLDNLRVFGAGGNPAERRRVLGLLVHGTLKNRPTDEVASQELHQLAEDRKKLRPRNWAVIEKYVQLNDGTPAGVSDHGTHVAGIIGARKPSAQRANQHKLSPTRYKTYVDGICPDIQLYDFRVLGHDRDSSEFSIIGALQYIRFLNSQSQRPVIHGANLSLSIPHEVKNYACGGTPICQECERLVESGVVVVAAAGNYGHHSFMTKDGPYDGYAAFSITDPGNAESVITVGSTHRDSPHAYGVSFFSSRGPTGDGRPKPDLVAPGERIHAPVRDHWDDLDGTSMAAPHVSGAAAMLLARYAELIGRPRRIKQILCESATDLGRERSFQGHGMLDVLRALQSI